MVQHSTGSLPRSNEINEFQLVHALITQSLKGLPETSKEISCDENANLNLDPTDTQSSFITAICQTFNTLNSANRKRIFPRSVKNFLSHISNKAQEPSVSSCSKSIASEERWKEQPERHSPVVRKASVIKASSHDEAEGKIELKRSSKPTSNVQNKVLQFEKQANPICSNGSEPLLPPSVSSSNPASTSCTEVCPGGTFFRPFNHPPDPSTPPSSTQTSPNEPHQSSPPCGRNLKRTPSERFQKMRRKVQKLMQYKRDVQLEDTEVPTAIDEDSFLRSIRIPLPAQSAHELSSDPCFSGPCFILRLPDHVLCNIFSRLNTRTLASLKCVCADFNFIINNFDIRATDSRWTKDERYLSDPCKQCRRMFVPGDMSMCRYHHKRFYSDLPYGRSYWMCCLKFNKSAPGCKIGLHDNHWLEPSS